jgi:hypothetical protein
MPPIPPLIRQSADPVYIIHIEEALRDALPCRRYTDEKILMKISIPNF